MRLTKTVARPATPSGVAVVHRLDVRAEGLAPARRPDQLGVPAEALDPRDDLPLRARADPVAQGAIGPELLELARVERPLLEHPRDLGVEQDLDVLLAI